MVQRRVTGILREVVFVGVFTYLNRVPMIKLFFSLITVSGLDMNITQFLKSLGLEHLRDIFETEQVSVKCFLCTLKVDFNSRILKESKKMISHLQKKN